MPRPLTYHSQKDAERNIKDIRSKIEKLTAELEGYEAFLRENEFMAPKRRRTPKTDVAEAAE